MAALLLLAAATVHVAVFPMGAHQGIAIVAVGSALALTSFVPGVVAALDGRDVRRCLELLLLSYCGVVATLLLLLTDVISLEFATGPKHTQAFGYNSALVALTLLLPVVLYIALMTRRMLVFYALIVGVACAAFLSQSETSKLLFLFFITTALLMRMVRGLRRPALVTLAAVLVAGAMPFIVLAVSSLPGFMEAVFTVPATFRWRALIWAHFSRMIAQSPWIGHGVEFARFHFVAAGDFNRIPHHTHNIFMQAWLDMGVVGAVAVVVLLGAVLMRCRKGGPITKLLGINFVVSFAVASSVMPGLWQAWWYGVAAFATTVIAMALRAWPDTTSSLLRLERSWRRSEPTWGSITLTLPAATAATAREATGQHALWRAPGRDRSLGLLVYDFVDRRREPASRLAHQGCVWRCSRADPRSMEVGSGPGGADGALHQACSRARCQPRASADTDRAARHGRLGGCREPLAAVRGDRRSAGADRADADLGHDRTREPWASPAAADEPRATIMRPAQVPPHGGRTRSGG